MTIKYIPIVTCEKCDGKLVESVDRVFEQNSAGGRRFIRAKCHGETVELPFADEAGQKMSVFPKAKEN